MAQGKPFEVDASFGSSWEGRTWIDWGSVIDENRLRELGGFKFLSYHVFSDNKCSKIRYSATKAWYYRKAKLLQEIKTYDAEIMCLQDVDHYDDWWQPQLMYLGYDSLFKQRTDEVEEHLEGVVIAYKRDLFQLFKTQDVILNRAGHNQSALVCRRCRTDDVGLIAFLQPWRPNFLDSAICVVSAMLSDVEPEDQVDVRFEQARYLTQCVENENRSYHVPVLMGISMHDTPDSAAYHVLRTGRSQLMPKAPKQVPQPIVEPFSRNSVYVKWLPPPTTEADPTILEYTVCWRPGGNLSIGYSLSKKTSSGDCIQYVSNVGEDGLRRTVALEYRQLLIPNLASETPFEFKVAATNCIGQGEWSPASEPFVLKNPPKASPKKPLDILLDHQQVTELREALLMQNDDWNAQKAHQPNIYDQGTNLTPRTLDGKPDRNIATARVLPLSTNPREGWKQSMFGEEDPDLKAELGNPKRMMKSVLIDESGFVASVSDTTTSKVASYEVDYKKYPKAIKDDDEYSVDSNDASEDIAEEENDNETFNYKIKEGNYESDENGSVLTGTTATTTTTCSTSTKSSSVRPKVVVRKNHGRTDLNRAQSMALFTYSQLDTVTELSSWELSKKEDASTFSFNPNGDKARAMNDDTIIDAKEAMESCGAPNRRQIHSLDLRSAYESYGVAGEPLYNVSTPEGSKFRGVTCMDYIFFTSRSLNATKILSIPQLGKLTCDDPRENLITSDPYWFEPPMVFRSIFNKHTEKGLIGRKLGKLEKLKEGDINAMIKKVEGVLREGDGRNGMTMWGGNWAPFPSSNHRKSNCWLPNEAYPSSHIALCSHFQIDKDNKSTEWR